MKQLKTTKSLTRSNVSAPTSPASKALKVMEQLNTNIQKLISINGNKKDSVYVVELTKLLLMAKLVAHIIKAFL